MSPVTKELYPALWATILHGMYDNGMVNRLEPEPEMIESPFTVKDLLIADAELTPLTDEQRDEFANGEHSDMIAMIAEYGLQTADDVLQEYFG